MKYIVTDPDHEWYGKEIEIFSNPGRGALRAYICRLKNGTKEARQYEKYLREGQFERID